MEGKVLRKEIGCKPGGGSDGGLRRGSVIILLVSVGVIIFAVHWPMLSARALMLDDDEYLVNNLLVQNPSRGSAGRFLGEVLEPSTVRGYYQPLTMISLMVDAAFGGGVDNLRPFHLTSLFLHIANSLLVIVLVYLLFAQIGAGVIVGLLYGVHPIVIESVAWVSERKTVLAAFFALWCLIFYVVYASKKRRAYYGASLLMYVLALLSKPTIIAMPILFILVDWWPLKRLNKRAIFEKVPIFIIGGIGAAITYISQARTSSVTLPGESGVGHIILIICHNIVFYLRNFLWPVRLSWYYPFPEPFDLSQPMVLAGVIGTFVLAAALVVSVRWSRCLTAGFLFFFFAIFPTLGVVGFHPMIAADRHMYFPLIGLLLVLGYGIGQVWRGKAGKRFIVIGITIILVAVESGLTRRYLVYWRDTESVYKYMLSRRPGVATLHNNLGNVLKNAGKIEEAIEHFNKSLELRGGSAETYNNLGNAFRKIGQNEEAIRHYRKALEINANFADAHYNLAIVLAGQGKIEEAISAYEKSLEIEPVNVDALNNLGLLLVREGKNEEARSYYSKAIRLSPNNAIAHGRLGMVLAEEGRTEEAIEEFRIVLKLRPTDVEMYCNLGILLEKQGRINEAIEQYEKALQIKPDYTKARNLLKAAITSTRNQ